MKWCKKIVFHTKKLSWAGAGRSTLFHVGPWNAGMMMAEASSGLVSKDQGDRRISVGGHEKIVYKVVLTGGESQTVARTTRPAQ